MDNGIYIALSKQMALFRDMDNTANNIANVNTTGFQGSHLMFDSYLAKASKKDEMAYVNDISSYRNLQAGNIQSTGNDLDTAIQGDGYFVVDTPQGERYTRAGSFQIDGAGTLITPEGFKVLDQNNQPITLPEDAKNIVIGSAGNISVNGEELATLNVVKFANPQDMQHEGNQLLSTSQIPERSDKATVAQGALEGSNVQAVVEMTHMIEVSRAVAGTAKYIEIMYELQRKNGSTWTQQV